MRGRDSGAAGRKEFIVIMKQNERRFEEHAQEIREAVEQLQLETV